MPLNSIKNMLHPCPDIIIGDCHQQSCTHYYSQYLSQLMQKHGLNVVHNHIFSGGYITKNYGNPAHLTFALQIEINRSLYMCEKKLRLKNSFFTLKSTLKNIFSEFMAHILKLTTYSMSVAAE
jgi:N-formylglutamate amidohydrolase